MKRILYAATAAALLMPLTASAQFLGKEDMAVTQPRMTGQFWAPKPVEPDALCRAQQAALEAVGDPGRP